MNDKANGIVIDCEAGRKCGCQTLCCQLMVMLTGEEIAAGLQTQSPMSGLLKQDLDGFCHYLDRSTKRCSIWQQRPMICRAYNCNTDPKLQVVVRKGLTSFTQLVADLKHIPKDEPWIQVPYIESDPDELC